MPTFIKSVMSIDPSLTFEDAQMMYLERTKLFSGASQQESTTDLSLFAA